ncbi:MAG TPA: hypothetical protein VFE47_09000 [Tepidisphaeraceae bacterium]|jgi:hypothetical protein|nr:hypothetical protein [Tepidisphaeraceae bacterium]
MSAATIQTPRDILESVADLPLPPTEVRRLQQLMDRNTEGNLSKDEREQLAAVVEWCENISLLWARALTVLAQSPGGNFDSEARLTLWRAE